MNLFSLARAVISIRSLSSPKRAARRMKNVVIGRALGRLGFWKWLWGSLVILVVLATPASAHHVDPDFRTRPLPLRVWVSPDLPFLAADAIVPWNALIPGLTLFTEASAWKDANVRVIRNRYSGAGCHFSDGVFVRCKVWMERAHIEADYGLQVFRHELGHTLGFADHPSAEFYRPNVGLRVCGDPTHEAYSPYMGVMSYCTLAFTSGDARAVAQHYGGVAA